VASITLLAMQVVGIESGDARMDDEPNLAPV
jgi:hypothetical protein